MTVAQLLTSQVHSPVSSYKIVGRHPLNFYESPSWFPGWYEFPNETATAGSIIGYSVPPSFATQLFMSVQSILKGAKV